MYELKSKLEKQMNTEWKQHVLSKPKLRTYMKFKAEYGVEQYVLNQTLTRRERSLFSQLRFGILPLKIETGRYYRIPSEERFCEICKTVVEDELHFILICPAYVEYRDIMSKGVIEKCVNYTTLGDQEKLKELMNNHSSKVIKFISRAWESRVKLLFV
jgi:hypothetical protein